MLSSYANRLIVRRTAAIGDSLCATVVADRLIQTGFEVYWQTHPANHCVIRRHPLISGVSNPDGFADVNLDGAYENDPNRRYKHFHQMFFEVAQQQLSRYGVLLGSPRNCKPHLFLPEVDKIAMRKRFVTWPRPWVFICPRSESYNVRQVPDGIWHEAAKHIAGTKFWLGRHPAPPGIVDMKCQHFDNVISYLSIADVLVSVDTGPMHVAAALGRPIVAIAQSSSPQLHLSDQCDYITIAPPLDCLNCQQNVCPKVAQMPPCQNIDPGLIAAAVNARWRPESTEDVSALISIHRPDVQTLNNCLEALLGQVQEIIVASDQAGHVPEGARKDPKIRYVSSYQNNIGYGRKINFAARHSHGRYLLTINDDCFLAADGVERMLDVMRKDPQIGAVSNLLYYPDGTIYHSGKVRSPGVRGWGHANHRQRHPFFSEPTEQENTCGCCLLLRRKAFYEIDGFDEDFFLFSEDDDLCLRLRRAGWRIWFTPHSTGVHLEHQSVKKTGEIQSIVQQANAIFDRKWRGYLDHNLNRIPGNFDY